MNALFSRQGRGIIDEIPEGLGAAEEGETTGLLQEDRTAKQRENVDARLLYSLLPVSGWGNNVSSRISGLFPLPPLRLSSTALELRGG